jgi:DNA-binding SARP family transcriptional activator/ABC-type branched-subunit amino acid transport system substrate-binding protein
VEFRILGPLEVVDDGRPLTLAGHKQRALLALLLLHRGQVVSVDRLIDDLWSERPPASAANSIHVYVSQLRKTLGAGLLETRGRGYLLDVESERLDLGRFERLLERGRALLAAGDPAAAAEVLREAIGLWRGAPLADFAYESFAQGEIARLEELRLAALEERIEADLALGRHTDAVAELEALVGDHPLRERMRAQHMLALYRSGRQAEALEAYVQARQALVDGLGIEPGADLRELQGAILRQDDALAPPARPHVPLLPRHRRAGLLIAAGGTALLIAGLAAAIIALTGVGDAILGVSDEHGVQILTSERCSPLEYGGQGEPDVLVAADLPLQRGALSLSRPMADSLRLELQRRNYKAGRFNVGLQVCDDAAAAGELFNESACAANARVYARSASVIGVVGPFASSCAAIEIPILNNRAHGPLAIVSPSNTLVELTRPDPAGFGRPEQYYPTGRRNYARVIAPDDVQAAANAIAARDLGLHRVFVLRSRGSYGISIASIFERTAVKLRLTVSGRAAWDPDASTYSSLAARIARTRADAVFIAGPSQENGVALVTDLRARLGGEVQIMAPDGFDARETATAAGAAAEGMTFSLAGVPNDRLPASGKRFVAAFSKKFGTPPTGFAVHAAQAMDVLLDAIARSAGTRASVARNLFSTRISSGILGSFWITSTGDTTLNAVIIFRIVHGQVTTYDLITVPEDLLDAGA